MGPQYRRYGAAAELGGFQLFLESLRPSKINIGAALNQLMITGDSLAGPESCVLSVSIAWRTSNCKDNGVSTIIGLKPLKIKLLIKNNSNNL